MPSSGRYQLLRNDARTRSFIGLPLLSGSPDLSSYVAAIDAVCADFARPTYYTDPQFHISVASFVGEGSEDSSPETESGTPVRLLVESLVVRSGHLEYEVELRPQR